MIPYSIQPLFKARPPHLFPFYIWQTINATLPYQAGRFNIFICRIYTHRKTPYTLMQTLTHKHTATRNPPGKLLRHWVHHKCFGDVKVMLLLPAPSPSYPAIVAKPREEVAT